MELLTLIEIAALLVAFLILFCTFAPSAVLRRIAIYPLLAAHRTLDFLGFPQKKRVLAVHCKDCVRVQSVAIVTGYDSTSAREWLMPSSIRNEGSPIVEIREVPPQDVWCQCNRDDGDDDEADDPIWEHLMRGFEKFDSKKPRGSQ